MADQPLERSGVAAAAARLCAIGDALFISAAEKQCDQRVVLQKPRAGQRVHQNRIALIIGGDRTDRKSGAKLTRDIADEAVEYRRHQRALLLGQALVRGQEEIGADRGKPVAASAAHACARSSRYFSYWPFFRHHRRRLIRFLLTSRQL